MASGKKTAKKAAAKTKAVAKKAKKAVARTKAVAKRAAAKTKAVAKKAAAKTKAVAKKAVAKTKAVAKKAAAKTKAVAKRVAAKTRAVAERAAAKTKAAARKSGKKAAKASPRAAALHRMATRHNWDDGLDKLQRILDDPDCDLGTALLIYWMGAPGFDREFADVKDSPDWRRPVTKFLRQLEKRLLARRFKTADILFNPRYDRSTLDPDGHDWTAEYGDVQVKRPIPAALLEPSAADPDWEERGRKPAKGPGRRLT